jgi:uncharacterized integral membrane protein
MTATGAGHSQRRTGGRAEARTDELAAVAATSTRRRSALAAFIVGGVIAVAITLLIVQNPASVGMSWLWFDTTLPLWSALALSFIAGMIVGPLLIKGTRAFRRHRHDQMERINELRG